MSDKKALKGLKAMHLFPVTENTGVAYKVGEKVLFPAAQELTKEDEREEYEIPADDEIYDSGSDYKYTTLEVTVAELDGSIEAKLNGGGYTTESGIYQAKSTDNAPEYALTYAALMAGGGYRLFRHPVVKLMSCKVDHKTKGDGKDIASYKLAFRAMARKIDGVHREQKDVAKTDNLDWITKLESLPLPNPPTSP